MFYAGRRKSRFGTSARSGRVMVCGGSYTPPTRNAGFARDDLGGVCSAQRKELFWSAGMIDVTLSHDAFPHSL